MSSCSFSGKHGANSEVSGLENQLWPPIRSKIEIDPAMEAEISLIMEKMSTEQKVAQMVQGEISDMNPDDMRRYQLGSVLNGGTSAPLGNNYATSQEWADLADQYWQASMSTELKIPMIWGTDAVHGHNNLFGGTIFPHNIGLGAANDPELVREIGVATAKEVLATGLDWTFAPTVAVTQNYRWGRTYESYSQRPDVASRLGAALVEGLQSDFGDTSIIATAKHWIGDGGTVNGVDQGDNIDSEPELFMNHGMAYLGALDAGVQTVMASFNSGNGKKAHGSKYLLNDVLKERMGFDGFIISDWNGHGQVAGCSNGSCPQAVNAGIDMFMISKKGDWIAFIQNTVQQVEQGIIPMDRIDDAVRRILRVKMRAGLFNNPTSPSERKYVKNPSAVNSPEHKAIAREAARKSVVLLKNNDKLLPLAKTSKVLLAGSAADDLKYQLGGWSLTWQSNKLSNSDFPSAHSVRTGLEAELGDNLIFDQDFRSTSAADVDVAVVVFGETPYAEGIGDLSGRRTLEYSSMYPQDLALLTRIKAAGIPVVAVFYSGRPMYTNKEFNQSDAFIAAFLPGSEAGPALADLMVSGNDEFDFTGKLSFPWPNADCPTENNNLFDIGFGLSLKDERNLGTLSEASPNRRLGCNDGASDPGQAEGVMDVFKRQSLAPWEMRIADPSDWAGTLVENEAVAQGAISIKSEDDKNGLQDAAKAIVFGADSQVRLESAEAQDLRPYEFSNGRLVFDIKVTEAPTDFVDLRVDCGYPCSGKVEISDRLKSAPLNDGTWHEMEVPLACFSGTDFSKVSSIFLLQSDGEMTASVANIRLVPGDEDDSLGCSL